MLPASAKKAHLPGSSLIFPERMIAFLPGFPSSPPAKPYGPRLRRSQSRPTWVSARSSISRMMPSPPRIPAIAAGIAADGVLTETHRVDLLEDFDGRVPGIRHVRVDGGRAVFGRARAHAAGDRLVIGKRRAGVARITAAERQIVHRALARGGNALRRGFGEGAQQRVDHALRGFDIAAGDCGWWARVDDRSGGRDYAESAPSVLRWRGRPRTSRHRKT